MSIEKRPNGVAVVMLNRPERLNAVNARLHHELARFPRDADADRDVFGDRPRRGWPRVLCGAATSVRARMPVA
jgi:hypothetical protein